MTNDYYFAKVLGIEKDVIYKSELLDNAVAD